MQLSHGYAWTRLMTWQHSLAATLSRLQACQTRMIAIVQSVYCLLLHLTRANHMYTLLTELQSACLCLHGAPIMLCCLSVQTSHRGWKTVATSPQTFRNTPRLLVEPLG